MYGLYTYGVNCEYEYEYEYETHHNCHMCEQCVMFLFVTFTSEFACQNDNTHTHTRAQQFDMISEMCIFMMSFVSNRRFMQM